MTDTEKSDISPLPPLFCGTLSERDRSASCASMAMILAGGGLQTEEEAPQQRGHLMTDRQAAGASLIASDTAAGDPLTTSVFDRPNLMDPQTQRSQGKAQRTPLGRAHVEVTLKEGHENATNM